MSITTKLGDDGTTSLMYGIRVCKSHNLIEACGSIDEMNAALGVARAQSSHEEINDIILRIQKESFIVGAEISTPPGMLDRAKARVTAEMVRNIEGDITQIEAYGGIIYDWAIPGENTVSAYLDLARTTCRKAERSIAEMYIQYKLKNKYLPMYINRLADLLWILARFAEIKEENKARSSQLI